MLKGGSRTLVWIEPSLRIVSLPPEFKGRRSSGVLRETLALVKDTGLATDDGEIARMKAKGIGYGGGIDAR